MITARGRNGWFNVAEVETLSAGEGEYHINVYSKRGAKMPPIMLIGSKVELVTMLEETIHKLLNGGA